MFGGYRRTVVVVASISSLNVKVRLSRQWAANVRQRVIGQPSQAIVVRFPRIHLVTRRVRITICAAGEIAPVIPRRQQRATRALRNVSLPLRTSRGIGVQLQRCGKRETIIGRANVIDVASITASAVLRINIVNYPIEGGRFAPAHVAPVTTVVGKHAFEVTNISNTGSVEGGAGKGVGPGDAAIG